MFLTSQGDRINGRVNDRRVLVTITISLLSVLLAGLAGRAIVILEPSYDSVLLVSIVGVITTPLVWRMAHQRFDPFEPILLFAVVYGIMFVVRPTAMIVDNRIYIDSWFQNIDLRDTFTLMLTLALIGSIAFVVGYQLPIGRHLASRLPIPPRDFHTGTAVAASLAIGSFGVLLFIIFMVSTGASIGTSFRDPEQLEFYRSSSMYLITGRYLLIPATVVLIGIGVVRRSSRILILGLFSLLVLFIIILPTGNRLPFLPVISGLLVFLYVRKGTRPSIPTLIMVVCLMLFASSFLLVFRTPQLRDGASLSEILLRIVQNPQYMFQPLTTGSDNSMAATFATSLQVIPDQVEFQFGKATLGDLIARPIPRLLWPEKPITPELQLIQLIWPEGYRAGIANPVFSALLPFYRELGSIGVALGMGLYGILARCWYEFFLVHRRNLVAILAFGTGLAFAFTGLRDNPVDVLWRWSIMVVPIWLIFTVAAKRVSSDHSVSRSPQLDLLNQ